jgi:PAS domain S-box-containing protein
MTETECPAAETAAMVAIDDLPLPYVEIDTRGVITRVNQATRALHHPAQGQLIGRSIWDLIAFDERDASHSSFRALIESGGDPPAITRNIFDRSGSFRTYQLHRSLIRDSQRNPAGMRIVGVDVTRSMKALDDARSTHRWLENAMASVSEAIFLVDTLGVIRSMNAAAETLSGFKAQELIGKAVEEASPLLDYQPLDGPPFTHLAAIRRPCRGIATLRNRQREEVKLEMSTSPIVDQASGSVIGVAAILRKSILPKQDHPTQH